jgi:putative glutamine amidotransferase
MQMNAADTAIKPIIGLTTYLEQAGTDGCGNVRAAFLPEKYLTPIVNAGAVPILLPPQPTAGDMIEHLVSRLDGLVIPGGWDVDPARYGQEPHPATEPPRRDRDEWEAALILEAIRQDVPLFCICRGEQLLNVTLGGTLHQHLPDTLGTGHYQLGGYKFNGIRVDIRRHSLLGRLLGTDTLEDVPVSHHQAVDRLGEGLVATAWSEDGVVEAIEHSSAGFCVGVQWHPEQCMEEKALFHGFVEAASAKMLSRLRPAAVENLELARSLAAS